MVVFGRVWAGSALLAAAALVLLAATGARAQLVPDTTAGRIVTAFDTLFGGHRGQARAVHAKGVLVAGTFRPHPDAAQVTHAAHLVGGEIPVVVRFSNFPGVTAGPDGAPDASPRGMAIRFLLPDGTDTDLVAHSFDGFPAATPEGFLAFLRAAGSGGAWPASVASQPAVQRFLADPRPAPASYATERFFGVNAFRFTDAARVSRFGRYRLVPLNGVSHLTVAEAAGRPPTGLSNRLHFVESMPAALARARRTGGLAVLCLDLDRFKSVNDTLGHAAGDLLLQAVAERLERCTRESDFVARLGGDEFAVVQEPLAGPGEAGVLAARIVETMAHPFAIEGHQVLVGISIGIAVSDGTVTAAEALLKAADLALYRAKSEGRGTFRFFEPGMDAAQQARRELELDLRRALHCQEFEVFYQPLVTPGLGISGFEALLRWRHPVKGLISPALFVPVAEEIGLIGVLGEWVLRQSTRDARRWPGTLKVAVNLSPAQFKENTLVQQVKAALAESGLDARQLELEITESVLMQEDASVLHTLHELRGLGVRIAMDDFRTGYSSLSYLRRFPFDKIKIDQSFVRGMTEGSDCSAIIKAVVGLGRSLNMAVNAEGVETEAQLSALRAEGCDEMQGYLFSRPQPVAEVPGLLVRNGNASLVRAERKVVAG